MPHSTPEHGPQDIGILGTGYAVPEQTRLGTDPVFAHIDTSSHKTDALLTGAENRRVLARADDLVPLMCASARAAMARAGVGAGDIDMVLGSASVSRYLAPNDLVAVHQQLGLSAACRVMSLNTEYTNFLDGLKLAHDMIRCGTLRHALVVCGNNWTHHVDYREPVSHVASDAAGAAIVGPSAAGGVFRLVDWDNETHSQYFGAMHVSARPLNGDAPSGSAAFSPPLVTIDKERGIAAIQAFGLKMPPVVVARLLARHGVAARDISVVSHQSSQAISQYWADAIQPGCFASTLDVFGGMAASSVPVTLAYHWDRIQTEWLVLFGIGMDMRVTALLYRRA